MPFETIFKKASNLFGFTGSSISRESYEDGEIVYSKNNVCVHTPSQYRGEGSGVHHPGYMVVKWHCVTSTNKSLSLTWIPNERLKRNHDLIHHQVVDEESNWNSAEFDSLSIDSTKSQEMKFSVLKDKFAEDDKEDELGNISQNFSKQEIENHVEPEIIDPKESIVSTVCLSGNTIEICATTDQVSGNCVNLNHVDSQEKEVTCSSDSCGSIVPATEQMSGDEANQQECSAHPVNSVTNLCSSGDNKDTFPENQVENIDSVKNVHSSEDSNPSSPTEIQMTIDASQIIEHEETSSPACEKHEDILNQIEPNSEDEISLDSSSDLQASPPPRYFSSKARDQWYDRSVESMAYCANLAFPESPSITSSMCPTPVEEGLSPIRRSHKTGIFSVDIGQMKSLRLFFSDKDHTCGQLVIASQESQYKILHFHYGGLDKLASVLGSWNFLVGPFSDPKEKPDTALKQFSVCRPQITDDELHPEEGLYQCLDAETWVAYFTEDGVLDDDLPIRRTIFFSGIEPTLRTNVWPFLLHYYEFRTTFSQRQAVMEEKYHLYKQINAARVSLSGDEKDHFWKSVQCTVEKDVVRTDRSKRCFAGADNPNLEKMKNILLNFAYYNPEIGYTQGMSDILAPILAEVRNEPDVFWCFAGMMSKTIFVTSPRDQDMEKNLKYLGSLLRIMVPSFYDYIAEQDGGTDLLFCHRWILLCFKREFSEDEVLSMWEACWSNYQTDYFHLFLVVSIISIYGKEVTEQRMKPDEMLLYFTSIANHMDGHLVLKKARGLLYQFRRKERVPCSLAGLCELCGPGMWDSGHAPTVVCEGHDSGDDADCCLSKMTSNVSRSDDLDEN